MKYRHSFLIGAILLAVSFSTGPSRADRFDGIYAESVLKLHDHGDEKMKDMLQLMAAHVSSGLFWAQIDEKKRSICFPYGTEAPTGEAAFLHVREAMKTDERLKAVPFSLALYHALRRRFPCP